MSKPPYIASLEGYTASKAVYTVSMRTCSASTTFDILSKPSYAASMRIDIGAREFDGKHMGKMKVKKGGTGFSAIPASPILGICTLKVCIYFRILIAPKL
jgi:hypothetical protein